jgi:hypothetical protein
MIGFWLLIVFECGAALCSPAAVWDNRGYAGDVPYLRVVYPTLSDCKARGEVVRSPEAGGAVIKATLCYEATGANVVAWKRCTGADDHIENLKERGLLPELLTGEVGCWRPTE